MHKIDVLNNGLRVVAEPMPHMESVAIAIWIRAGGRYENIKNNGISHLLEHLLFKGTIKRDMKSIKEEIEGRGGSFNGFTAEEFTCYLVKVLAKDTELAVDILSDMVLNPRLADEEIGKEKNVIIEEIHMYRDIPSHYVHEILSEMMWPDQPLGMPLAGSVESVKAITRDDLVSYRENYYNPKNMMIISTGPVKEGDFLGISEKYLSSVKQRRASEFDKARLDQGEPRVVLSSKNTEQTHMVLGLHTMDRFHSDKHVLSLINVLLGANMSSRLFSIVRDEMALCYEISSSLRKHEDCGAFVISAGVDHNKLTKTLEVILKELSRIKREGVDRGELQRAKEYYRGQLLFAMEDTMSRMLWLGEKIISGEKDFDVKRLLQRIEEVTADDIMRVSHGIFKNENLNLALIGPIKDEKPLKEIFDIK